MSLLKYDPFSELDEISSLFNRGLVGARGGYLPVTDIYNDDKEITVEMHVPHFKEEEISVEEHDGVLEIKARHEEQDSEGKKESKNYVQRESVSEFYRSIALPNNADREKIEAHLEDGILRITIPFREQPKPKKVSVKKKASKK